MGSYQRVLVGVDGTPRAFDAAIRAIDLAAQSNAELHVVAVVPVPSPGAAVAGTSAGGAAIEHHLNEQRRRAAVAVSDVEDRATEHGVRTNRHIVDGDPATMICRIAQQVSGELIIVGNRGVDASGRYVLGSVPEAVLHGAACDVLIVRTV